MEEKEDDWGKYQKFVLSELERVGDGLEAIRDGQSEISAHLQSYNAELRLHIRGVLALERRNEIAERQFNKYREEVDARLEVVEAPIVWASTTKDIAKWVFIIGSSVGLLYAGMKFMGWV